MIDNLQQKIKSYKKQIEEAEAIAALNLSKYKQVHTNLAIRSEEAETQEHAVAPS
jgi:myosin heavy chain 6/7